MKKAKSCLFSKIKSTQTSENTKFVILDFARKAFCEKGFEGTSLRDICKKASANVSAIKYYFGDKSGLYKECFHVYGQNRLQSVSNILTTPSSFKDFEIKLFLFFEDFLKEGLENIHTNKMIWREIENENPIFVDLFHETYLKVYQTLVNFFNDSKKNKIIRKNIDSHILTSSLIHSFSGAIKLNHIIGKQFDKDLLNSDYRRKYIENILNINLMGITNKE